MLTSPQGGDARGLTPVGDHDGDGLLELALPLVRENGEYVGDTLILPGGTP